MWCLPEWHCENPLNVFIIIGPKVGTQSLCRFSLPPSPCVTGLPALLKLLRNYLRDFKCPLIGNGRHAAIGCLTSISAVGTFQSGAATSAPFRSVSGSPDFFYVLMHHRLCATDLMASDLCESYHFLMHMDGHASVSAQV